MLRAVVNQKDQKAAEVCGPRGYYQFSALWAASQWRLASEDRSGSGAVRRIQPSRHLEPRSAITSTSAVLPRREGNHPTCQNRLWACENCQGQCRKLLGTGGVDWAIERQKAAESAPLDLW